MFMIFLLAFFSAYLNPLKIIILDVNHFGEANIEAIMYAVLIPISIYGMINIYGYKLTTIILLSTITPFLLVLLYANTGTSGVVYSNQLCDLCV